MRQRRTNCLVWAVAMWARLLVRPQRRRGGRGHHFSGRKSDWGWFPHFGVMLRCQSDPTRFRFVSYKPLDPRKRALPPLIFHGSVRWGD